MQPDSSARVGSDEDAPTGARRRVAPPIREEDPRDVLARGGGLEQPPSTRLRLLTIAGSDSSGGAGIQADLKTFSALGVYGASAITALTAQNTKGVDDVMVVPPEFVLAQMRSVASDLDVKAIKIGMLGTAPVIEAVADGLDDFPGIPVVLDPVMDPRARDGLRIEAEFLGAEDDGEALQHLTRWLATFAPGRRVARRLVFKVLGVTPYRPPAESPILHS